MVHQCSLRDVAVLVLSERPLVNDALITRIVKQARCYPWLHDGGGQMKSITDGWRRKLTNLEDEPPSEIDTANGLRIGTKSR